MTVVQTLRVVPSADSPATRLRALISVRDGLADRVRELEAEIARYGRLYADERGEKLLPTIERLRRDLRP